MGGRKKRKGQKKDEKGVEFFHSVIQLFHRLWAPDVGSVLEKKAVEGNKQSAITFEKNIRKEIVCLALLPKILTFVGIYGINELKN